MGERSSTLIMKLVNGVSGPASQINAALDRTRAKTNLFATQAGKASLASSLIGAGASKAAGVVSGAAAGLGVKAGIKAYADEERTLTRIGIRARATQEEMREAEKQAAALVQEIGLPEEELFAAMSKLAKGGKTISEAMKMLPDAARAAQAYGIEAGQAAATTGAMIKQMGIAPERIMSAWDMLDTAASKGKVQVTDFAEHLPGLMANAAMIGWKGETGLRKLLAVIQSIAPQFGSTEEAIQAVNDGLAGMHKKSVIAGLKKVGVDLPAELAKGVKAGKDPLETFYNVLLRVSKGSPEKLSEMFRGGELGKFVYALQNAKDKVALYNAIVGDTGRTLDNAKRASSDAKAQLVKLNETWNETLETIGRTADEVGIVKALKLVNEEVNLALDNLDKIKGVLRGDVKPQPEADQRRTQIEGYTKPGKQYDTPFGPVVTPDVRRPGELEKVEKEIARLERGDISKLPKQEQRFTAERLPQLYKRREELKAELDALDRERKADEHTVNPLPLPRSDPRRKPEPLPAHPVIPVDRSDLAPVVGQAAETGKEAGEAFGGAMRSALAPILRGLRSLIETELGNVTVRPKVQIDGPNLNGQFSDGGRAPARN